MFVCCYLVQIFPPRPHSMQKQSFSLEWIACWMSVGWYKPGLTGWLLLCLVLLLIVICNCLLGLVYMSGTFQFSSVTQTCLILCDPMGCSTPGFLVHHNSWRLLTLMFIELVMPSSHLVLCYPLCLLPSIYPSIRVFSNESVLRIRWPKYWSFCFSISLSNEYSGLISFRIHWFELLAVHGTLNSLLQHHSSKASILSCSTFFTVQLSHPYMTTGKTIALTRWPFVGKVMSLLFSMLTRLVIAFLPRSKSLLISWL